MKYKDVKKLRQKCIDEVVKELNARNMTVEILALAEARLRTRLEACGMHSTMMYDCNGGGEEDEKEE